MESRNRNFLVALVMVAGGLLLIVGAVLLIWNIQAPRTNTDTPPGAVGEATSQEINRVSLKDAKAAYDSGNAFFVDVRESEFYVQSHIPGALSIPLGELAERIGELNSQDWIITYCT